MARLLTTGFELGEVIEHNAAASLTNTSVQDSYARTGTYAWRIPSSSSPKYFSHSITSNPQELYIRLAVMFRELGAGSPNDPAVYQAFVALIDSGVVHLSVVLDPDTMRLHLLRGATGTLGHSGGIDLGIGSAVLRMNAWYVVELYAKIANSGGAATVKVNNTTDIGVTDTDTAASSNEYISVVRFGESQPTNIHTWHEIYLDDIAINDTTGSYQNSWIGQGGVYLLKPDGDGATTDWTPSAGSVHYEMVDEVPDDASTTYITAGTAGHIDLFDLGALPATVATIDMVQPVYQTTLEEAGFNQIRDVLRANGTNYAGPTQNVTSEEPDYIFYAGSVCYTVPGGTAAWGTADVNALQIGVEVV